MENITTELSRSIESKPANWDFIDKVVYINLDDRNDRNEHMKRMTATFGGDKVVRFSAIRHENGHIGCLMSHISVLKMAIENKWKNVCILEDDAEWNNFEDGYKTCKELVSIDYDVIMLGWNYGWLGKDGQVVFNPSTKRIYNSISATGYIVDQKYLFKLHSHLNRGLERFLDGGSEDIYSVDRSWNSLQKIDKWFAISPCLVYQIPSYSDTEKNVSNCLDLLNIRPKWNFIDKVICINSNANMGDNIKSLSYAFKKDMFETLYLVNGNQFQYHINILRYAKDKGYQRILVIEDDLSWVYKFEQLYAELADKLDTTSFDMISLSNPYSSLSGYIINNSNFNNLMNVLTYRSLNSSTWNYLSEPMLLKNREINFLMRKPYSIFNKRR